MSGPIAEMAQEINELRAEIARHHKDFAEISLIAALGVEHQILAETALHQIRRIVG